MSRVTVSHFLVVHYITVMGLVYLGSDCPQNHKSLMLQYRERKKVFMWLVLTFVVPSRVLVCYGVLLRGLLFVEKLDWERVKKLGGEIRAE
jgi:hypothetical protein